MLALSTSEFLEAHSKQLNLQELLAREDSHLIAFLFTEYGASITDKHFTDASVECIYYCFSHGLHLEAIRRRAYYLVPPLYHRTILYQLLYEGVKPPAYRAETAAFLLEGFLASKPSHEEVSEAFEKLLDEETALLLLEAYPLVPMSVKAVDNAIRRKILSMVKAIDKLDKRCSFYFSASLEDRVWFITVMRDELQRIGFELTPYIQDAVMSTMNLELIMGVVKEFSLD